MTALRECAYEMTDDTHYLPEAHFVAKRVLLFVGCKNKVRRGGGADVLKLSIQLPVYGVQAIVRAHGRPSVQILSGVRRAL